MLVSNIFGTSVHMFFSHGINPQCLHKSSSLKLIGGNCGRASVFQPHPTYDSEVRVSMLPACQSMPLKHPDSVALFSSPSLDEGMH